MGASLLLCLAAAGSLGFDVDWAAFRAGGDSSRIEFYYAVPHDQLLYVDSAGSLQARFTVAFVLADRAGNPVSSGEFVKRARLGRGGFADAVQRRLAFVDAFSVTVAPGTYRFSITVTDSTASGVTSGRRDDSLTADGFAGGPCVSSLQLGSRLVVDSLSGALAVIPNPSGRFGAPGPDTLYFYLEGYGFAPEPDSWGLETRVIREGGADTVVETGLLARAKSGPDVSAAFGLSLHGVKPGQYRLLVALTDFAVRRTAIADKRLRVGGDESPAGPAPRLEGLTERELRYYRQVQYLATPRQLAFYQTLTDFLQGFLFMRRIIQ